MATHVVALYSGQPTQATTEKNIQSFSHPVLWLLYYVTFSISYSPMSVFCIIVQSECLFYLTHTNTHTRLTALFLGLPG